MKLIIPDIKSTKGYLKEKKETILWLGGISLTAVVVFFLLYLPLIGVISRTVQRWHTTVQKIDESKRMIAQINYLTKQNSLLKEQLLKFNRSLTGEEELSNLLKTLIESAKKSDVDFISIRPLKERDKERHKELPFRLELTSKYHNLGKYINLLHKSGSLIKIEEISLSSEKTTPPEVEVKIGGVAFFIK
ncbi:MAG: type 4a pilus biogenesis protein PilO [Candidatus Edwardsbacteria bacterium]